MSKPIPPAARTYEGQPERGARLGRGGDGEDHEADDHHRDRHLRRGRSRSPSSREASTAVMPTLVDRMPSTANSGRCRAATAVSTKPEQVEPGADQVGGARQDVADQPAEAGRICRR